MIIIHQQVLVQDQQTIFAACPPKLINNDLLFHDQRRRALSFFMAKKALKQLKEAVEYLKKKYRHQPEVGIVVGSGLGNFTEEIEIEKEIDYSDIPNFP